MIAITLLAALLMADPSPAEKTPPSTSVDAGVRASTSSEDAEVEANLELLQNMPAVENLELIQALEDDK